MVVLSNIITLKQKINDLSYVGPVYEDSIAAFVLISVSVSL